jgi:3',5'-cyclic-AMP phosphodiesterase
MPFHLLDAGRPTRREFLAGVAMAAVGATARAAEEGPWLALVSDTHIPADPKAQALGQTPAENLRVVVADILGQPRPPEAVLINGDLALKDGQPGDYATFLAALGPLRKAGIPLHLALGNHDDRAHFRAAIRGVIGAETRMEEKQVGVFDALGHRFAVLDSLDKVNGTPGRLGTPQLTWLGRDLDAHRDRPTVLFVHHNPRSTGIGLLDDGELFELITPRPWVKAVVFGHTHRWTRDGEAGMHLVNLPAVAYTFEPNEPLGYCRLRATPGGATIELRDILKKAATPGETLSLSWRS